MGCTSDFLVTCMQHAEWPPESMELVIEIGEQVGYADLADELCDRAERACDGWQGCLRSHGDGRGVLCEPCPLTTKRDASSDEVEGVAS